MNYAKIIRGPAKVTYNSQTFYSQGEITVTYQPDMNDIVADAYGIVDKRRMGMKILVEFTPVGEIEALTTLYPYASSTFGASIFGASNKPLVIVTADETLTILNAAVTQMPSLSLSTGKAVFGQVQFTGIVSRTALVADLGENASYFTTGAGATIGTDFDPTKIITTKYVATYDDSTDQKTFDTEEGFEITFEAEMAEVKVDGYGIVDIRVNNVGASTTFLPLYHGDDQPDWLSYHNNTAGLGSPQTTETLTIVSTSTGGIDFAIPFAIVSDVQMRYGSQVNKAGQVTITSGRKVAAGTVSAPFTITTKA